jgi:SPP1 family predicted phage head-tail adaptor
MLTAGCLRESVIVQQPTDTADGQGGFTTAWSTLATVRAMVKAAGAREALQQAATGAQQMYEVAIRYRDDVTPRMRLSWRPFRGTAKTLQIHGVQPHPDQPRAFLRLMCAEVI